jgi:hypothetical protein
MPNQKLVPGARDLVKGEPEKPRLIDRDVEQADRDAGEPEATRGDEARVAGRR